MTNQDEQWQQSVMTAMRKDFSTLDQEMTIEQALNTIRQRGAAGSIIYSRRPARTEARPQDRRGTNTLAFTDIFTLLFYFGTAALLL